MIICLDAVLERRGGLNGRPAQEQRTNRLRRLAICGFCRHRRHYRGDGSAVAIAGNFAKLTAVRVAPSFASGFAADRRNAGELLSVLSFRTQQTVFSSAARAVERGVVAQLSGIMDGAGEYGERCLARVLKIKAFRAKWVVIGTKTKNPGYLHNRSA